MKRLPYILLLLLFVSCNKLTSRHEDNGNAVNEIRYEYGLPVDSFHIVKGTIRSGETLGGILSRLGATPFALRQLHTIDRQLFDVRQIRAGKDYMAFYQPDSVLNYFIYQPDVLTGIVLDMRDTLHVEKKVKEVKRIRKQCECRIESSLWNAMVAADANPQLALELSEIYAWTIDFFGLQKGDCFNVYYDESYVDDTVSIGISRIYAAAFKSGKTVQEAFFFENQDLHGYFDREGNSLQKAFLKAPLNYKRISSGFTYHRKHPIYKTVRPHTGVDYAAPMGTPVVAIGDGVVIDKGYKGGGGNTVKIRHNSTYTSAYLHLSKYGKGIERGVHVLQGQVIGYVGSTGASTGPHLDFRVWKNNKPINPLTMESPPVAPIPERYQTDFQSTVQALAPKIAFTEQQTQTTYQL